MAADRSSAVLGLLWSSPEWCKSKVSLFAATDPPASVIVRLESLRLAAIGHEDGAMPGAGELPAARTVRG